ncbi:MAG: hypothetical protein Q7J37_03865 [Candidatus Omnitrophota bacterium]|nr:hypothetical protein [Candidatus Omnitrophota bacterium]
MFGLFGSHDFEGNLVDKKTHQEHVVKSVKRLKAYWPKLEIIGLWVNSHWQVEVNQLRKELERFGVFQ